MKSKRTAAMLGIAFGSCLALAAPAATGAALEIVEPAHDKMIFSNPGQVTVHVQPDRPLAPSERIELWVDGAPVPPASKATEYTLRGLPRGAHWVQARIVDRDGDPVEASAPTRFFVWKASVLHPHRQAG